MKPAGSSSEASLLEPLSPRWQEVPPGDDRVVAALTESLRLPFTLCAVLAGRGHADPESAKRFLRPLMEHLHDPALLADGPDAAKRIVRAVEEGETILVHGDYDVDGICATALLTRFLGGQGARVVPFVPHRLRDGYDLSDAGLRAATEAGASLIVTADCGTVALEPIARARAMGIDVVVTDHHTVGDTRPPATAFVNPQRPDCPYPEKGLCGTGLAFKLAQLVAREMALGDDGVHDLLDLVAMATVADLVPLRGENRVLVKFGLRRFATSRVPGITALLAAAGVDAGTVTAGQLGFVVAPRINAAGRIGESADALRLLLTDDPREAATLAAQARRDQPDAAGGGSAHPGRGARPPGAELRPGGGLRGRPRRRRLASRRDRHRGVAGGRAHPPSDGPGGAGRRPGAGQRTLDPGIPPLRGPFRLQGAHGSLRRAQPGGRDGRGHGTPCPPCGRRSTRRRAGGCSRTTCSPVLRPDVELDLEEVDLGLVHWLEYLGPHGIGNPRPVFLARGVHLEGARVLKDAHLKVSLRRGRAVARRDRVRPGGRAPAGGARRRPARRPAQAGAQRVAGRGASPRRRSSTCALAAEGGAVRIIGGALEGPPPEAAEGPGHPADHRPRAGGVDVGHGRTDGRAARSWTCSRGRVLWASRR